uniref:Ig-like domain-containing protein n=1 Tax=Xiphophorus couchianus TaxID=32473 RepID=A0A3B5M1H2_9TELE
MQISFSHNPRLWSLGSKWPRSNVFYFLHPAGSDGNPSVTQSPAVKSAALGETVSLSCSASEGVDDDLSWYLQKPGQPPKLLFYKISSRQSDTPSHFSSSGSEPQFTLTISGVQAEDAGDYYCMGVCKLPPT